MSSVVQYVHQLPLADLLQIYSYIPFFKAHMCQKVYLELRNSKHCATCMRAHLLSQGSVWLFCASLSMSHKNQREQTKVHVKHRKKRQTTAGTWFGQAHQHESANHTILIRLECSSSSHQHLESWPSRAISQSLPPLPLLSFDLLRMPTWYS